MLTDNNSRKSSLKNKNIRIILSSVFKAKTGLFFGIAILLIKDFKAGNGHLNK
jgi:hypothetical protein